ncbi:MAG: glycosyltransferase family 4 protein [Terracidiphilus sp.]
MRIAVDLRRMGNPGIGRYMKCLVEALTSGAPQFEYVLIVPPAHLHAISTNGHSRKVASLLKYYSISEQIGLPRLLRREGVQLFHSPHFLVPLWRTCPQVVTIHDVIHLVYPQDIPSLAGRLYSRAMVRAAVRLSDHIITVSEFSKRDILRHYDIDAGNVHVIYSGIDKALHRVEDHNEIDRVRRKYGIEQEYILYAGIYRERKNHAGLFRAFAKLAQAGVSSDLVIAGPLAEGEAKLRQFAKELGIVSRVRFPGFVPDEEMPALYSGARVYACPSMYEGFGFTILEAMNCGTPVVCNPVTSLPEVAGDAALFADASSPDVFAAALHRAMTDESCRAELRQRGYANVKRFSWRRAAEKTADVYALALETSALSSLAE